MKFTNGELNVNVNQEVNLNIKENSKNLLKIQYIDSDPNDNYLMTITASENGNTINIIFSDDSNNSYTYNKVSEGCK